MNIIKKLLKNISKGLEVCINMKKVAIIGLSGNSLFYEVDHLPNTGESIKAYNLHVEVGGKGYNQAVACKRSGLDVSYLSSVGKDDVAVACEEYMDEEGINYLFVKKDTPSASASILRAKNGDNEVIVFDGANSLLNREDLDLFKNDIIESDCLLLTYEIPYEVLKEAMSIANQNNIMIVLNPAPYIKEYEDLLSYANVVTPNETELKQMFDLDSLKEELIRENMNKHNIKSLVITCGKDGCIVLDKNTYTKLEGEVVDTIDTTGAGDVFNAYLVSEILNGKSIEEACKYANHMAAISTTKKYVLDAIPKR